MPQPSPAPTGTPTAHPSWTVSPTVGRQVALVPIPQLSLQSVGGDPALAAVLNAPAVQATAVDVTVITVGEMNFTGRASLPSVTIVVVGPPTTKDQNKERAVSIPVAVDRHAVLSDAGRVKASVIVMFAQRLGLNVRQIKNFAITFSDDGVFVRRRAAPLLSQAAVSFTVCAQLDCGEGGSGDDDFPGWALGFSIALPVLFLLGVAAVYFFFAGQGGPAADSTAGGDKAPYGDEQSQVDATL